MPTLITGSFAYDTIMVFQDQFKNHILPDQTHILNVSFYVPEMRREFGGCAGNIAYNLKLLGGEPLPMGAVGEDFAAYKKWLQKNDIDLTHVREIPGTFTAQAFVTTDADNNQITAFHPGAMDHAHENKIADADNIALGIIAPNGREAMLQHAAGLKSADIPFIFDPGQGLPMFDGEELQRFIAQATYLVVNDYESELLQEKTAKSLTELAAEVKVLIVTKGGDGADIHITDSDEKLHIPAAKISEAKDPTGCGDAFRAGLLYGITNQLDWKTTTQIATLTAAQKIEHYGTQNHHFTKQQFEKRYKDNFGDDLKLK